MHRKIAFILNVVFWVFIILFLTCNKDKTPTDPQLTSLEEEIDHTKCSKELEMCCLNSNFWMFASGNFWALHLGVPQFQAP